MKISVFGSGYVGLVQAAVLAEVGHDVVCMDIDKAKVEQLSQGQVHIFEPGLANLVRENLDHNRLVFTSDEQMAVEHAEVLFIAVGTPSCEDGSADMRSFFAVGESIARHRSKPLIIVEKSTVPVAVAMRCERTSTRPCVRLDACCSSISFPTPNFSRKARP